MVVRKLQNGQDVEERLWPNHRHHPGIYPLGLRKIMRNFSQGCHLQYEICNPELHTTRCYQAGLAVRQYRIRLRKYIQGIYFQKFLLSDHLQKCTIHLLRKITLLQHIIHFQFHF
jgi:hypothetical protein